MIKNILVSLFVSIVVLTGFVFVFPHQTEKAVTSLGGPAETLFAQFSAGLSLGDPGSQTNGKASKNTFLKQGTCNPTFNGTSFQASTTATFICRGLLGVKSGDNVYVSLPAGARTSASTWFTPIDGYATTSDAIGFDMVFNNGAGTATSSFPLATTSVRYMVWRTSLNP